MGSISRRLRLVAVLGVAVLALAACSSDDKKSDDGGGASSSTSSETKASSTVDESSLVGCKAAAPETGEPTKQRMSVEPCEGLTDGQTVKIYAAGFTAGLTVGITECSTETDDTGSGCNLEGLATFQIGDDGTGSGDFTVKKGPFGKDNVVCSPPTQCLLSVGELAAGEVERADGVDISFVP